MTNTDKIRAMSDEDLAAVIMCPKDIDGSGIKGCPYAHTDAGKCYECSLKWLREECKEEDEI